MVNGILQSNIVIDETIRFLLICLHCFGLNMYVDLHFAHSVILAFPLLCVCVFAYIAVCVRALVPGHVEIAILGEPRVREHCN